MPQLIEQPICQYCGTKAQNLPQSYLEHIVGPWTCNQCDKKIDEYCASQLPTHPSMDEEDLEACAKLQQANLDSGIERFNHQ